MTELIERYRRAGSGIVATSATLITLVGCIALFLQSRLGSMHYPRLVLTTGSHSKKSFGSHGLRLEYLWRCSCTSAGKISSYVGWPALSCVFHVADLLDRELALRSFAIDYPWVVRTARLGRLHRGDRLRRWPPHLRAPPYSHRPGRDALARQRTSPDNSR